MRSISRLAHHVVLDGDGIVLLMGPNARHLNRLTLEAITGPLPVTFDLFVLFPRKQIITPAKYRAPSRKDVAPSWHFRIEQEMYAEPLVIGTGRGDAADGSDPKRLVAMGYYVIAGDASGSRLKQLAKTAAAH